MHLYIRVKKRSINEFLYGIFLLFCFIPFLFPNPIVKTNIQPYAALLGVLILLFHSRILPKMTIGRNVLITLGFTFISSVVVMLISGVSIDAIRGVYNYFALFIIPCAVMIILNNSTKFPENLFKIMIVLWFLVASIQFFIYRGFATQLISSVRWSYRYRGVVGLASEPSFLGITCFYFLHMIKRFKTQRLLFYVLVLLMGILYAQSTTGIMFIAGFYAVFLIDMINSKKGIYVCLASVIAVIGFGYYLTIKLSSSRLNQILVAFMEGGVDSVLTDGSANVRFNAIGTALSTAASNMFMPGGFGSRIGSAYGGLLVELGILAIPAIILISFGLSQTFEKTRSRVVYFFVVTILLLNNTQIGNPLLLMVIGINLSQLVIENRIQGEKGINAKICKSS